MSKLYNRVKRAGYKAGEIVGKQKNLPEFLKKKILKAKKSWETITEIE